VAVVLEQLLLCSMPQWQQQSGNSANKPALAKQWQQRQGIMVQWWRQSAVLAL